MQWLMPPLTTDAVAEAVVRAVEYNHDRVVLPRMLWALPLLELLPVELLDALLVWVGGANEAMRNFRGPGARDVNKGPRDTGKRPKSEKRLKET